MKERPILFSAPMVRAILDGSKTQTRRVVNKKHLAQIDLSRGAVVANWSKPMPYGQTGDRLWVRESFWGCDLPGYGDQPCVVYDDEWEGKEYKPAEPRPWGRKFGRIPSIHMPRESSRITLEVNGVRVERLQDISEADAKAEGAPGYEEGVDAPPPDGEHEWSYRASFQRLWESINGPGSWDLNPWVWAVELKRFELVAA